MAKVRREPQQDDQVAQLERTLLAARRMLRIRGAREKLLDFATLMLPDPHEPDNPERSRFQVAPHHVLIAQALERVRAGTVTRLAISMPPRKGKSEIATRLFPAWFIGHDPYAQVILAGATAEFAKEEFGRKIRGYMETPAYQQVFPGAGLRGGSKAVDAMATREGGSIKSIGKGGQLVGRGADCLIGSTPVVTEVGVMTIQQLHDSACPPRVLSFRHRDRKLSYNRIEATRRIDDREIWRLVTNAGRVIAGTADHRVYCGSRGYVRLCDLRPGDELEAVEYIESSDQEAGGPDRVVGAPVCALQQPVRAQGVRGQEVGRAGALRRILRQGMLGSTPRGQELPEVRELRRPSGPKDGQSALLGLLRLGRARAASLGQEAMLALWDVVLAPIFAAAALHARMRECGPCGQDDRLREFPIRGRDVVRGVVPTDEARDHRAGRVQVRGLRPSTRDVPGLYRPVAEHPAGAPYRRDPGAQLAGESGVAVQALSRYASQKDTVLVAGPVRGVRDSVYDLQVEGNRNFFAGEVLVHNCVVIDDPYSGREEAMSAGERRKVRQWFTSDVISRMMPGGRIVVIHQRWHEDDLIGWLTDPNHPEHNPRISGKWMHLYLPAIIYDEDLARAMGVKLAVPENEEHRLLFGSRPSRPLWPERYGYDFYSEIKSQDSRAFEALYMGNPTPEDGEFFRREDIVPHMYAPAELPRREFLRIYVASDHAVSTAQERDATCFVVGGVDADDVLWILDVWWERKQTDDVVDAAIDLMQRWRPLTWWAEKGHISKSIGPFLRKRMHEERTYTTIVEVTPAKDKMTRAQAIQARMAMGKVRFPQHAPWMEAALEEMLKFPFAKHDDFVDTLSHLGGGLARMVGGPRALPKPKPAPKPGTLAWIKQSSRAREKREAAKLRGGF